MIQQIPHTCPVCNGQKIVSRPPYLPGDISTWTSSQISWPCKACNETGIVWATIESKIEDIKGIENNETRT